MPDVPRDRLSDAAARVEAKRAAYAEHLADVTRSAWRLGVIDGRWRVARRRPGVEGWVLLDESLAVFPDIDVVAERRRVSAWLRDDVLGVRSVVRRRDYGAAAEGREAFDLEVMS